MSEYSIHLCPPAYPKHCRPWSCRHQPQFVMTADARIVKGRRGNEIVLSHAVCLACGAPRPSSIGGNVLVDLSRLWDRFSWHAQIGGRIAVLRNRWLRIASKLFGEDGWNGRHERIARLIDPPLTMRFVVEHTAGDQRFGRFWIDPELFDAEARV